MNDVVAQTLARWDMAGATATFVAGRENKVFRVTGARGDFALRIRRLGLRDMGEVRSELQWMAALERTGLPVPRPKPATSGALVETVAGHYVDMLGWLPGHPLGASRVPLALDNPRRVFFALGKQMAHLHSASDAFTPPKGFVRAHWDAAGLLGEGPLWGRFWENPALNDDTRAVLETFRTQAIDALKALSGTLDFGLIHADLVRENVLVDGNDLWLIDFDDGGYGFRLFDVATALLKNRHEPDYPALKASLLDGYLSVRELDMVHLDLFMALRAVTYVGWIIPRLHEDGGHSRNAYLIDDASALCAAYLAT